MKGMFIMKISTKGRYALRMLVDLAINGADKYVALKDIAERQQISKKYLEQIVLLFNGADVLEANRGFQGGYRLARDPKEYTIGEILRLTEGSLAPVACLDYNPNRCDRCDNCETLYVWEGLHKTVANYLNSITLEDILDKNRRKQRETDIVLL